MIIILLITIFFLFMANYNQETFSNNDVPKKIFTYWDSNNPPQFILDCQKNWRKFAPNYTIHFLNQQNIENWITLPKGWKNLPPYRQSDLIRLLLIHKYGGIWLDASILLMNNPDNFVKGLTLFTTPDTTLKNPVYENWFIAAPAGNELIKRWYDEVIIALKNKDKYINQSPPENVKKVGNASYLICHLALKNIMGKPVGTFHQSNKTAFYYHTKRNWKNIWKKPIDVLPDKLLVKIRGNDRKHFTKAPDKFIS